MANAGGGAIVYGIAEEQKRASGRADDVALDEGFERTLRQVAASKLAPGLLSLRTTELGAPGRRCVVVEVPASADAPHLIFSNDRFRAPVRVDADTHWMSEREIEAAYRARFTRRTDRAAALAELFERAQKPCDTSLRAWFVAAAVPRVEAVAVGCLASGPSSASRLPRSLRCGSPGETPEYIRLSTVSTLSSYGRACGRGSRPAVP